MMRALGCFMATCEAVLLPCQTIPWVCPGRPWKAGVVFSAVVLILCAAQGSTPRKKAGANAEGRTVLLRDTFDESDLRLALAWHVEGEGKARVVDGRLALQDGGAGIVVWARRDFPSDVSLQFDLSFSNNRGIGVFFLAAGGTKGEDILDDLPARSGKYGEYTQGRVKCYGVSLHRFFPDGSHNAGTNIRKNPGFHLVHHVEPDPVMETNRVYHVRIAKEGGRLRLWVDTRLVHDWEDDGTHGGILNEGKIGFRLRAHSTCLMFLDNVIVQTAGGAGKR